MQIGFIGAGNMARALALGWGEPVLCTDSGSGRAAALAADTGGEALAANADVARQADVVVLAHKPAQLESVAAEIAGVPPKAVVSLLARTSLDMLRAAYPGVPVARVEPNTPVQFGQGVSLLGAGSDDFGARELFSRVGAVVELPESMFEAAAGVSAVGPAYWALLVEAQVDAAVRRGIPARQAAVLVTETMRGSAELIAAYEHDTLGVRRAVASPGGTTARGLAALERGGIRAAFDAAMTDIVEFR